MTGCPPTLWQTELWAYAKNGQALCSGGAIHITPMGKVELSSCVQANPVCRASSAEREQRADEASEPICAVAVRSGTLSQRLPGGQGVARQEVDL